MASAVLLDLAIEFNVSGLSEMKVHKETDLPCSFQGVGLNLQSFSTLCMRFHDERDFLDEGVLRKLKLATSEIDDNRAFQARNR